MFVNVEQIANGTAQGTCDVTVPSGKWIEGIHLTVTCDSGTVPQIPATIAYGLIGSTNLFAKINLATGYVREGDHAQALSFVERKRIPTHYVGSTPLGKDIKSIVRGTIPNYTGLTVKLGVRVVVDLG